MRRALASLLIALFSLTLIAPILSAGARPELPPCCRRNGKHHCGMADPTGASHGAAVTLIRARCPLFPGTVVGPSVSPSFTASIPCRLYRPLTRNTEPLIATPPPPALSTSGAIQKRGPPSILNSTHA